MRQAAAPRLANVFVRGDVRRFKRLVGGMLAVSVGLGVTAVGGALLVGEQIIRVVYGVEFARYVGVFSWVLGAAAVGYLASPLGFAMTAMRIFRVQPLILTVAIAAHVGAAMWLVPRHGLVGATWSWGLGSGIQVAWGAVVVLRGLRGMSPDREPVVGPEFSDLGDLTS